MIALNEGRDDWTSSAVKAPLILGGDYAVDNDGKKGTAKNTAKNDTDIGSGNFTKKSFKKGGLSVRNARSSSEEKKRTKSNKQKQKKNYKFTKEKRENKEDKEEKKDEYEEEDDNEEQEHSKEEEEEDEEEETVEKKKPKKKTRGRSFNREALEAFYETSEKNDDDDGQGEKKNMEELMRMDRYNDVPEKKETVNDSQQTKERSLGRGKEEEDEKAFNAGEKPIKDVITKSGKRKRKKKVKHYGRAAGKNKHKISSSKPHLHSIRGADDGEEDHDTPDIFQDSGPSRGEEDEDEVGKDKRKTNSHRQIDKGKEGVRKKGKKKPDKIKKKKRKEKDDGTSYYYYYEYTSPKKETKSSFNKPTQDSSPSMLTMLKI